MTWDLKGDLRRIGISDKAAIKWEEKRPRQSQELSVPPDQIYRIKEIWPHIWGTGTYFKVREIVIYIPPHIVLLEGTDVAQRPIWPEYITPFSIRQVKLSCCNWYWSTANLILISRIIRGRNIFGQTLGLGGGLCFGSDRIINLYNILISDTEVFQLTTIVNFILPAPQLATTEHHNCLLPNIPQLSTPLCGGWPLRMPSSL